MNPLHYKVYQRINEVPKVLGFSLFDEFLPATCIFAGLSCKEGFLMGIAFSVVYVFFIRHMKQGQGKGWLFSMAYWYLPNELFSWHKVNPASYKRFWL